MPSWYGIASAALYLQKLAETAGTIQDDACGADSPQCHREVLSLSVLAYRQKSYGVMYVSAAHYMSDGF
jgi:hypothetical protein